MTNVGALSQRVTEVGFKLVENERAIDAKFHSVENVSKTRRELMWVRGRPNSIIIRNPATASDYIRLIESEDYSYLMEDGGIVQVALTYDRGQLVRHCLVYFPCPYAIEPEIARRFEGSFLELIYESRADAEEELLRTPIRFDFAPEQVGDFHPSCHLTINGRGCRVPVRSPVSFDRFMEFVLENFYREALEVSGIRLLGRHRADEDVVLTEKEMRRMHLNWI